MPIFKPAVRIGDALCNVQISYLDGQPHVLTPLLFRQEATDLKFGALATLVSFDWDEDGDEVLLSGNTAGYIGFIENLDGGNPPPRRAAPEKLKAAGLRWPPSQPGIGGTLSVMN